MKFIEKLLGKNVQSISLQFTEIPGWIEKESEQIFSELRSHIRQKYEQIGSALDDLNTSAEGLMQARLGENVPKRAIKIGESSRDNLIKNLRIIIERTSLPEDLEISSAFGFYDSTRTLSNTCLENAIRSQQYVKALFPEEFKDILLHMKNLNTLLEEFIRPLNEKKDIMEIHARSQRLIEDIRNNQKQIDEKGKNIQMLEEKLDFAEKRMSEFTSRLSALEGNDKFIHAKILEDQVLAAKKRIDEIDSVVVGSFTPLSKALSRIEKLDDSGRYTLDSGSRDILKRIKDDPVALLRQDISQFLLEIRKIAQEGHLGLKQNKLDKTIAQIDKLTGTDLISSLKEQRENACSEFSGLLDELNGLDVYREKTELEGLISDCRTTIESLEQKKEIDKKDLAALVSGYDGKKEELLQQLDQISKKEINISF